MASIWQKTFGKMNKKRDVTRRLSEELVDYAKDFGYKSIAEAVTTVGGAYAFVDDINDPHHVYKTWREAMNLGVLDDAVVRATEKFTPIG